MATMYSTTGRAGTYPNPNPNNAMIFFLFNSPSKIARFFALSAFGRAVVLTPALTLTMSCFFLFNSPSKIDRFFALSGFGRAVVVLTLTLTLTFSTNGIL